ncbi:MAG: hypothetical protein A2589_00800 [Candidatus Vogelbacteria bacterium RIFOXYD1_FULL_46_19]|uniref:Phosphatidic acid phosphatase type 2/haloperoxidase domain-containing protein n=1 Tax=Candidatus Vogelbacteria bacterium RIFOXYD1_FULL_46_19 TaxID=1802439 RepID=A0A1G2QG81_9BACT|nr:MAG: hypothetical protein A2589_00800 [Candidatus Vogelbacteria bacterium RIFOXYD1_FULL_46_19]
MIEVVDLKVMTWMEAWRSPVLNDFFLLFTRLGDFEVVLFLTIVLLASIWFGGKFKPWLPVFSLLTIALAWAVNFLLKLFMARSRPLVPEALVSAGGFAWPSGHALVGTVLYGLIVWLIISSRPRSGRVKRVILLAGGLVIFLVGLSRVYLGVHWFSDVVAGWILGALILILFNWLVKEYQQT